MNKCDTNGRGRDRNGSELRNDCIWISMCYVHSKIILLTSFYVYLQLEIGRVATAFMGKFVYIRNQINGFGLLNILWRPMPIGADKKRLNHLWLLTVSNEIPCIHNIYVLSICLYIHIYTALKRMNDSPKVELK